MEGHELLSRIWSNQILPRQQGEVSPIAQVLEALLQQRTIGLIVAGELSDVIAMAESDEIMPQVTLGDVLAEEMGIYLDKGTLVVFEPSHLSYAVEFSGHELGQILGRVLLDLAGKKCCPALEVSDEQRELQPILKGALAGRVSAIKLTTINHGASRKTTRKQANLAYLN